MNALVDVHAALLPRVPMLLLADVERAFAGWEVVPVTGGAVLVNGNEVHVAVKADSKGRWCSRRLIREILGTLLRQHGVVKTSVMFDNEAGKAFVQRLGFESVGCDEGKVNYELRSLRF